MKLKKIELLDIYKAGAGFEYIYGAFGTSLFSKKFYKITFSSDKPQWWWTEIQKQMAKQGIFFEDLLEQDTTDIGMGNLRCVPFSKEDTEQFSEDLDIWKKHLDNAVEKSRKLSEEYVKEHGDVDLSDYGLFKE